jgi:hypothetical protein
MAMGMSRQDRIGERAYQLWEQAGRPSGRDLEHWARAEAELRVAPPRAPGPAPTPPVVAPAALATVQPPRSSGERAILGGLLACFVLALVGIAAYATVSRLDARQALELERFKAEGQLVLEQRKLEAQLLLEAARGGDAETVARNLRFLIAAGLLADRDHKIAALAAAGQVPVIATPAPEPEPGNVNSRRIVENGSDFLVSSRASPEGDRTIFTYRVTNNGAREETVDWGDILHATIAPGRSASIVKSAAGAARSAATFFQWGTAAKTLVYAFVPGPAGSPQDQPAP